MSDRGFVIPNLIHSFDTLRTRVSVSATKKQLIKKSLLIRLKDHIKVMKYQLSSNVITVYFYI
jgi:hypothetical protein